MNAGGQDTGRDDSSTDSKMVGSVGLVYTGIEDVALRALFSQGFRIPSLTELYIGKGTILPRNPDLEPEKSDNYEIGARYSANGWNVDTAVFYSRIKNAINSVQVGPSQWRSENVAKAESYGIELVVDYTFVEFGLTPYISANYLRYEIEDSTGFKTHHTSRSPLWGTGGLKWEHDLNGLTFFVDGNIQTGKGAYNLEHNLRDGQITEKSKTDSWYTANLSLGFEGGVTRKYNVALNLRNLLDEYYQIAGPYSASNTIPEPGFHAVFTFGVEF